MEGYETIMWLVAAVMMKRDFYIQAEVKGVDKMLKDCPYDDLTDEQRATFEVLLKNPLAKSVIRLWWAVYDSLRAAEVVPSAQASNGDPWMP